MSVRRLALLSAMTAAAFSCGAGVAAAVGPDVRFFTPAFPAPIVSASSQVYTADTMKVAVQWVKRCAGTVCPAQFHFVVSLNLPLTQGPAAGSLILDTVVTGTRALVLHERWRCDVGGGPNDTLAISVSAVGANGVDSSVARTAKLRARCRSATMAELTESAALRDTFPQGNTRLVWAPSPVAGNYLAIGGQKSLCSLARNRYTKQVVVRGGDPVACESVRVAFEREVSG